MASLDIRALYSVAGKTAVITGGGSGLGQMMATAFVVNGGNAIISSRKEKALKSVCDDLNARGPGKATYISGDISTAAGCFALAEEVKKLVDKVHVLVNNSGTTWGAPYESFPETEGWDRVLGTNVKAIFYLTSALTPLLAKDATNIDPGRVIVIASVAGLSAAAEGGKLGDKGMGLWSYNASKAAAISLSNNLATTLGPKCITVNCICPGVYPSKMTAYGLKQNKVILDQAHPMGRIGTAEDMAGLFLMLSSRAGSHISASTIVTDGGAMAAGTGYAKL